ncbi:MAG: hypothetical protein IT288_05515 [Bdellovibrionales bacterium]|nr:hypothetical protein [Bdellovibrionales bacterium]
MQRSMILISLMVIFSCAQAYAADVPVRARVFLGASNGNLSNVNTELKALGLDELDTIPIGGAEITYTVLPIFEVGLNYVKKQNVRKTAGVGVEYQSEFDQSVFLAVARFQIVKSSVFRLDVFAGAGGSNTTLKINSATQSGELSKRDDKEFVAAFASRYGASIAAGYKGFYLFVEGGYESNKVDSLTRTGTLSSNISSIDMSGPYGFLGLLIDAPDITRK